MAVRLDNNPWVSSDGLTHTDLNNTLSVFTQTITLVCKNHIRTLFDRAGVYSADETDVWGEAYTDANGRNDSVDTANTTAIYNETDNAYRSIATETGSAEGADLSTSTSNSSANSFDITVTADCIVKTVRLNWVDTTSSNLTCDIIVGGITIATKVVATGGTSGTKTFSFTTSDYSKLISSGSTVSISLSTSFGNDISIGTNSYSGTLFNIASQTTIGGATGDEVEVIEVDAEEALVYHDIPSGRFSSTISKAIGSFIAEDWESGADVQFKLQSHKFNGNDITEDYDSGSDAAGAITSDTMKITSPNGCKVNSITVHTARGTQDFINVTLNGETASFIAGVATFSTPVELTPNVEYTVTFTATSTMEYVTGLSFPVSGTAVNLTEDAASCAAGTSYILEMNVETKDVEDDSGWLDTNVYESFTAFTAEPDTLIVKLIPKTTSPTSGYPSIKGFALRCN